jgi:hypothetical protein
MARGNMWGKRSTYVDVVGRRLNHFVLAAIENVGGHELALGVSVLARLRGGHVNDLAGVALDHEEGTLPARPGLVMEQIVPC